MTKVLEGFSCHFPKDDTLEVQKGARGIQNSEATVACVFLADTAEQSRSVMRQLERFISEIGAENRAISLLKMTKFNISSW